jgi:hypothetical protein
MFEMGVVLLALVALAFIAYEFVRVLNKREWGENTKSIF